MNNELPPSGPLSSVEHLSRAEGLADELLAALREGGIDVDRVAYGRDSASSLVATLVGMATARRESILRRAMPVEIGSLVQVSGGSGYRSAPIVSLGRQYIRIGGSEYSLATGRLKSGFSGDIHPDDLVRIVRDLVPAKRLPALLAERGRPYEE